MSCECSEHRTNEQFINDLNKCPRNICRPVAFAYRPAFSTERFSKIISMLQSLLTSVLYYYIGRKQLASITYR